MRSEDDIRFMLNSMWDLVAKYDQIKQAAARRRDPETERAATVKEASYRTIAESLSWALGEREMNMPAEDIQRA